MGARRRYRATLLLQSAVLVFCLGALTTVVLLLEGRSLALPVAGVLLVLGWVAFELEALPKALEWWVLKRARAAGIAGRSRWFIDVDAEEREAREQRRREVEHNPAVW